MKRRTNIKIYLVLGLSLSTYLFRPRKIFKGETVPLVPHMRIASDIDDTLLNFVSGFIPFLNKTYAMSLKVEDVVDHDYTKLDTGTPRTILQSEVRAFYHSPDFMQLVPVPHAPEAINALYLAKHELSAITARPQDIKPKTEHQIGEYFPNMFNELHHTDYYSNNGLKRRKSEVCTQHGIELLIEDNLEHAQDCVANSDTNVILLDNPWNQAQSLHPHIIRVSDWRAVKDIVERLSSSDWEKAWEFHAVRGR